MEVNCFPSDRGGGHVWFSRLGCCVFDEMVTGSNPRLSRVILPLVPPAQSLQGLSDPALCFVCHFGYKYINHVKMLQSAFCAALPGDEGQLRWKWQIQMLYTPAVTVIHRNLGYLFPLIPNPACSSIRQWGTLSAHEVMCSAPVSSILLSPGWLLYCSQPIAATKCDT